MKLQGVILFSENPQQLTEFYSKVLQKDPDWEGGDFVGFGLENESLVIGPHDKVHGSNTQPERIMINFETDDVQGEFERIRNLGAKVIAEPYQPAEEDQMWLCTFEDPDGNFFQLGSPIII
ncbi:MAG: hypothetical protein KatS3mg083_371 [Candidatus Dojkabacteria bacterium]|nr:MAG: hypothetical protein KatS3mg083_371 [Candidatus Dojkabacteria bacterium]